MITNMLDAKTNLSKLIAAAEAGEEVLIARHGAVVAKLVKYSAPKVKPPGAWANYGLPAWNDIDQAALDKEIEDLFYDA